MSVLVATRHNAQMKQYYEHLKENAKHSTQAQIAVMRKMIVIAHSLYKNNERYDPEKYLAMKGIKEKIAS